MASSVIFRLLAVLCVHSAAAKCPVGSVTGLDRWTCYKVYPAALSWVRAERECKAENGHLATISSAANNSFLQDVAGNVGLSNYWLGGARDLRDGAWYWSDGSSWNYTNWVTGLSINGSVCLAFNAITGKWFAEDCCTAESFLCQLAPISRRGVPPRPPNLPPASAPLRCAYGWQYLEDTNLCYTILEHRHTAYSWNQAKSLCSDAGGGMLSIPNKAINDAIVTYVLEADVDDDYDALIIGASYQNSTGKWQWSDGSEMRYTNWAVGKPADLGSRFWCGYMRIEAPEIGAWRNLGCTDEQFIVICERESFEISSGGAPPPPNLPTPPPPVRCPNGWLYLEATNLCYSVMEPRENQYAWKEARNVCTEAGGDLVSIPNKAVNDALIALATDAEFIPFTDANKEWASLAIGASYDNVSRNWEWSDGSDMRYTNWYDVDRYVPVDGCAYMVLPPPGVGTWLKAVCSHDGVGDWMILCERSSFDV